MIRSALERGEINPALNLLRQPAANTGIALAMIACLYGLEIELVMPSNSTRERTLTMEALAPNTLLEGIELCRDYAEKRRFRRIFVLNQFANPIITWRIINYRTRNLEGYRRQITHFVSSMGTTGLLWVILCF